tara:strand:- start:3990 stop:4835 length:846 start_codon:yes stop_codon:yes gene_type:complete
MQPSRDDFVIAIRSAFLSKGAKQRFSLLLLIFFSLVLIVLSKFNFKAIEYARMGFKEAAYRSSFVVSIPEKYIQIYYYSLQDHLQLYKDYKDIKLELQKLKAKEFNNKYIISENERLKETIEARKFSSDEIHAKVLLDKESPFLKSIIINKGSQHNIKLGMAVLDKGYLVGKVIEVNFSTSRVLLLTDLNSKIPVNIEPGGIQSIMSGTGKKFGKLQYFKSIKKLPETSIVYTSGAGGVFKPGIPIGMIKSKKNIKNDGVDFFTDFLQLRFVNILVFEETN